MPNDKPKYLAYVAHCAKPTHSMSLAEQSAHYREAIRLEDIYLASVPRWKTTIATCAVPLLIGLIGGATMLFFFFCFFSKP